MTTEAEAGLVHGCFRVAFPASDIPRLQRCRGAQLRSYLAPSGFWIGSLGEGGLLKAAGQWGENGFPGKVRPLALYPPHPKAPVWKQKPLYPDVQGSPSLARGASRADPKSLPGSSATLPPSARNKYRKRLDPVSQPLCCLAASWPDIRGPLVTTGCYCSENTKAGLTYRDWKVKRQEQMMAVRGHQGQHLLFVISKALGRKPFPKKARWIWS